MTDPLIEAITSLIDNESRGAVLTVLTGPNRGEKAVLSDAGAVIAGGLSSPDLDTVAKDARELMDREHSVTLAYGDTELFFEMITPRPVLFLFGAVHIAQEMVRHGSLLGFRTVVADPRPAFVTRDRFPEANELRVGWPNEVCDAGSLDDRTFVVVLTHDRRFEDPLWPIALESEARYIGAMGSAKTTAARAKRLAEEGHAPQSIARIHGPIGLDIGSRTAGETAIAILAEMISVRYRADDELDLVGLPQRA